jgi:hypothetical protein
MRLFIDYIATKKAMAPALGSIAGWTSDLYAFSGKHISDAMALLVTHAASHGDIRADIDLTDLLSALVGFTYGNEAPDWERAPAG